MNRQILEACLPCIAALAIALGGAVIVAKASGARLEWRRLGRLHRCQDGGVQSLAFVLTLPIFITLVLFIVQVSQLMVGMMVVNYAAFTAARAAAVWLPAEVPAEFGQLDSQNRISIINFQEYEEQSVMLVGPVLGPKFERIKRAATLACAPVAPSRDLGLNPNQYTRQTADSVYRMYLSMAPQAQQNSRISVRILNKLAYSADNTHVFLEWRHAQREIGPNILVGPTYNPRNHPDPAVIFRPYEVGWQDPITVYVVHRFALLPGPAKWLARRLVWTDSLPLRIETQIGAALPQQREDQYGVSTVLIPASATIPNEGMKSLAPYRHDQLN